MGDQILDGEDEQEPLPKSDYDSTANLVNKMLSSATKGQRTGAASASVKPFAVSGDDRANQNSAAKNAKEREEFDKIVKMFSPEMQLAVKRKPVQQGKGRKVPRHITQKMG